MVDQLDIAHTNEHFEFINFTACLDKAVTTYMSLHVPEVHVERY